MTRVDSLLDNILLEFYIVTAMLSLILQYGASAGKFSDSTNSKIRYFSPLVTQYVFGGLLSGMLIFYGRSGAWMVSWPFLLVIMGIIYGNETIKDRVQQLLYSVGMLFVGLFAYVVLIVPVVIGKMGAPVFVGSGILSLLLILIFIRVLALVVPRFIALHQRALIFMVGIIFATFNFLYFTNIIPPIPLSLKDVGIFHSVVHFENGSYQLSYEQGKWWQFYRHSDNVFHPSTGGSIFCFAKVFAPTSLNTDIYHRWERYDTVAKKWVLHSRLAYPIVGGGADGYRGYSLIKNYSEGTWRCTVETDRGQVLGREVFTIDSNKSSGNIVTRLE